MTKRRKAALVAACAAAAGVVLPLGCTATVKPRSGSPTATVYATSTVGPAADTPVPTASPTTPPSIPTVTASITPTAYYLASDPRAFTFHYQIGINFPAFGFVYQDQSYGVSCYVHLEDSFTLNDVTSCAFTGPAAPTPVSMQPMSGSMTGTVGNMQGFTSPPFTPTPDAPGTIYTINIASAQGFPFGPQNCTVTAALPLPTVTSPSQWTGPLPQPGAGASFTLAWDPIPGATEYTVWIASLFGGGGYVGLINGSAPPWSGTATSVSVSGLTAGQYYRAWLDGHTPLDPTYGDQNLGLRYLFFVD